METSELYDAWAGLLSYPDEVGRGTAAAGLELLREEAVPGAEELTALEAFLGEPCAVREETYTHTFDGTDRRALEVGWHLHGENYARGTLMVRFRTLLAELGLREAAELPDHLGVVLGLLGRLDQERARALVRGVVLPALARLAEGFEDEENPYRGVVAGVRRFLARGLGDDRQGGEG